MARIFITLYIGIIVAIFGVFFAIETLTSRLFYNFEEQATRQTISAYMELFEQVHELAGPERLDTAMQRAATLEGRVLYEVTDPFLLSRSAIRDLPVGDVIAHSSDIGEGGSETYYFRLGANNRVYQTSPDLNSKLQRDVDTLNQVYIWSFFLMTALTIGLWSFLLHHKLKLLECSAMRIADGDFSARAPEQFRHRVGGLNRSFNQMAERIEQLLASHKRLTNAVAHELRTPIFRLRCQLELLEHGIEVDQHRKFVGGMDEDLSELDELVNELLSHARLERSGVALDIKAHDLSQWLTEILPVLARSCRTPLALTDAEAVRVEFDASLLMRVLNNLVRNADNYSQHQIEVRLYREPGHAVICVDDDGIGIPEADRQRVLQPFERVDNARTRQSGGHGLGLSIVKEIIQQHRGRVVISTSSLGGARVAVYLPLHD